MEQVEELTEKDVKNKQQNLHRRDPNSNSVIILIVK